VAEGSPAELAAGAQPRLRFRFDRGLDPGERAGLATILGPGRLLDDGATGRYRLDGVDSNPDLVAGLAGWCAARALLIAEVRTTGSTPEERYLELTGGRSLDG
jgi:ABC-2 type transport system ATP-binding protein